MKQEYQTPHGHCVVCGHIVPPELQDQGVKYCSRACEHAMTGCGPEKDGVCIVCGEFIPVELWKRGNMPIVCGDVCRYHLQKLCSRAYSRRRGRALAMCPTCGAPVRTSGAYCSPSCRPLNPSAGNGGVHQVQDKYDGYHPTDEEWNAMYEGLFRWGILDDHYEVEQVMADASTLHGRIDWPLMSKLRIGEMQGAVALKSLNQARR